MEEREIIGVDCATKDEKVAVARSRWTAEWCEVRDVQVCSRQDPANTILSEWLRNTAVPVLLAIDAPLGWPVALSPALSEHCAGKPLAASADSLFRRATDRFIKRQLKKTPLDVGADRIARTAHTALGLLERLRRSLGHPIPLAWVAPLESVVAIEVYPAATLIAHGFRSSGYKKAEQTRERREIFSSLRGLMSLPADSRLLEENDDALDAVVCVLGGKDFLDGRAMAPEDTGLAKREGWIWAGRPPGAPTKAAARRSSAGQ